jgi:hypothetical protein
MMASISIQSDRDHLSFLHIKGDHKGYRFWNHYQLSFLDYSLAQYGQISNLNIKIN